MSENKKEIISHTFIDMFSSAFPVNDDKKAGINKIVIPMIQRDYAQGRENVSDIKRIRKTFLDALYNAIVGDAIKLDFIYGDIDSSGMFTPLDGQQRLTTLFLLHWFAAKKEKLPYDEYSFLKNFSYMTRYSAREFCSKLVEFNPLFNECISKEIENENWFPLGWKKDPTVSSMLVMLDAINEKFKNVEKIWDNLKNGKISFYVLIMSNMGLTDSLYIKMNSRGKILTPFENFKAEFEKKLSKIDKAMSQRIISKFDLEWTDLLWNCCDKQDEYMIKNAVDDSFLRYFRFISDIIYYKKGINPSQRSADEFDILDDLFSADSENVKENIDLLEKFFDCWVTIEDRTQLKKNAFFESIFASEHQDGKIIYADNRGDYGKDIFNYCVAEYGKRNGRQRIFPINRMLLLYAIIIYLTNNAISTDEFSVRIRMINNLIQNSQDELAERETRNNISYAITQIDSIMIYGEIDLSLNPNFNQKQLNEEADKKNYLKNNPADAKLMHELEDHALLYGQISIVGIDNISLANRFIELFKCDWDKVDCALMSIGFYAQQGKNKIKYQFGSSTIASAWDSLFHKSDNFSGYDRTHKSLIDLLNKSTSFDDSVLDGIIDEFVTDCEQKNEFTLRYYYVKYKQFRPDSYGKYVNRDYIDVDYEKYYVFSALCTRSTESSSSYIPYLKAADSDHIYREEKGKYLLYKNGLVGCDNKGYCLISNDNAQQILDRIDVKQNADGIDTEDRIKVLSNWLKSKFIID